MQFWLFCSHFNSSFLFIFFPTSKLDLNHVRIPERVVRRWGRHTTIILLTGALGGGGGFYFPLPTPRSKQFFRCQTPTIVFFVVMLEVVVVAVAVVCLTTLASLTAISLDLALSLDLFPTKIQAKEVPIRPPPSRRRRHAGDRTSRTQQRIGGIARIHGHHLSRPLWR